MAKDYGRKRSMRQKSSAPKQLFWILASFLCGYLTATVFDFTSLSSWVNANILTKHQEQKAPAPTAPKQAELPKPKFEFYTLLAKDRTSPAAPATRPTTAATVPIQTKPAGQAVATTATSATTTNQLAGALANADNKAAALAKNSKDAYLLQIASFRNKQDAERMKAALTLKGFDVTVSPSTQQQITWFRVIVGPFNSRMAAEKVQLTLAQSERIKGMIRKMEA